MGQYAYEEADICSNQIVGCLEQIVVHRVQTYYIYTSETYIWYIIYTYLDQHSMSMEVESLK